MPCKSFYNGWSPEERRATVPIQIEAFRTGRIERPTRCSICGFDKPERPSQIVLHTERYDQPLVGFGVCRRCHSRLHERFDDPARWLRLLHRVAPPDCWARKLSMDPASQFEPFHVTYPKAE